MCENAQPYQTYSRYASSLVFKEKSGVHCLLVLVFSWHVIQQRAFLHLLYLVVTPFSYEAGIEVETGFSISKVVRKFKRCQL